MLLRLLLRFALTAILLWILAHGFSQYLTISGSAENILIIAAVMTILNMTVRPILTVLTFPLRLFFVLPAIIVANTLFLLITIFFLRGIGSDVLAIHGGIVGWIAISLLFGCGNWLIRVILQKRDQD